jgi:hypothetical protein
MLPAQKKPSNARQIVYSALLGLVIGVPTLFLIVWGGWAYGVVYLMGVCCATALGAALESVRK